MFESLNLSLLLFGQLLSFGLLGILGVFLGKLTFSSFFLTLSGVGVLVDSLSVDELSVLLEILVFNSLGSSGSFTLVNESRSSLDDSVGLSHSSKLFLDLGLALFDDLHGFFILDEFLLSVDASLASLSFSLLGDLLGWGVGDSLNWVLLQSLAVVLQPSLTDLLEFFSSWDEDLLVFKTSGVLSLELTFLDALKLVVVLSVEDIQLVAVSVTILVQLVELAVESSSVVNSLSADITDLSLTGIFWEQNLFLGTNQLLTVSIVGEALLDTIEGLLVQALTLGIELDTLGNLVLVVSGGTFVSTSLSGVVVALLDTFVTLEDSALLLSVDRSPLRAGTILSKSSNTVSSVWSDSESGTLTLNKVLKLFLLMLVLDFLKDLGRFSDDILVLLDLGGQFLDFLLTLTDLSSDLGFLDLELLSDNWGSFSLDSISDLGSLLGKLFNSFELSFLLVDLLGADLDSLGSDVLFNLFLVLLDLLVDVRLDSVELEGTFLLLSFELSDELVDLSLLGLDLLELLFGFEDLVLVDLSGHLTGLNTFLVLLHDLFEGVNLLVEIQRFLLLLIALVSDKRNSLGKGDLVLEFLFKLDLLSDSGLHINEFVVKHLRIDLLDGWVHSEGFWFDGSGDKSSLSLVSTSLHLNDVLGLNIDDSSSIYSYSC